MTSKTTTIDLTDLDFEREALGHDQPVLVDFWAPWCPPCRALAPTIAALAQAYEGRARVVKVNVDAAPRTAARFGIQSIPTLVFLDGGREVERVVGAQSHGALARRLDALL